MIESTAPQGSDEWRLARCGIATASRFADVMETIKTGEAASRRNYRADLVVERLTGKPIETFQSAAMKQGTEREPLARQAFENHSGMLVRQVGFFYIPDLAGASPDGLMDDEGLEIKCPERATHLDYLKSKEAPSQYYWQMMGQMWICNLKRVHFVSWNPDFPERLQLVHRVLERDESELEKLAAEVTRFMNEVKAETETVRNIQ